MNFLWRIKNTYAYFLFQVVAPLLCSYYQNPTVNKYVNETNYVDVGNLFRRSELWFMNMEPIVVDFPRVSAPHYIHVGGIGASEAKPLRSDLEDFMQSNQAGCVVMAFGSLQSEWPSELINKFLVAFRVIRFNVIIGMKGSFTNIPSNVKVVPWIPQSDLLGHPKTRLFITHGGNNGQIEAVFHGVPQIVFPSFIDQHYNAMRVQSKGYGIIMDKHTFTPEDLIRNIDKITNDPTFTNKAKQASRIFRSLPSARERLAFWVNHVLQFGGRHLQPPNMDMPLYQFLLLDGLCAFVIVAFIVYSLTKRLLSFVISCFFSKTRKRKTE